MKQGESPPMLPAFVLVQFTEYTGPSFLPDETSLVPIASVQRKWFQSKVQNYREMLPIIPLYAITIDKSQGQTLNKIILNIGDKEFASGLTYTAIS